MSLPKLFERIFWHNNTTPAINETNLNAMSKAINDIDDRVIELGGNILEVVPQIQSYLEQADDLVEAMEELSQNPPYIGANGNWYVFNTNTEQYEDSGVDASITVDIEDITMLPAGSTPYVTNTGTDSDPVFHLFIPIGAKGDTGDTPNITMSATADALSSATPTVTVTKTGTAEAPTFALAFSGLKGQQGVPGQQGDPGDPGDPGVSPTVTITTITGGHRVTITDEDHPTGQSFDVMDGSGSGDMTKSVYDSDNTVANAGGIKAWVQSLGYITGLAWSALTGKPFSSVGSGLTVSSDALTADIKTVTIGSTGTASSSAANYQRVGINGSYTEVRGSRYMETSAYTTSGTNRVFTFTNVASTAVIDGPYCDKIGVSPTAQTHSGTTYTVSFATSDAVGTVRIYLK